MTLMNPFKYNGVTDKHCEMKRSKIINYVKAR